jgi:hypothetical protein
MQRVVWRAVWRTILYGCFPSRRFVNPLEEGNGSPLSPFHPGPLFEAQVRAESTLFCTVSHTAPIQTPPDNKGGEIVRETQVPPSPFHPGPLFGAGELQVHNTALSSHTVCSSRSMGACSRYTTPQSSLNARDRVLSSSLMMPHPPPAPPPPGVGGLCADYVLTLR